MPFKARQERMSRVARDDDVFTAVIFQALASVIHGNRRIGAAIK